MIPLNGDIGLSSIGNNNTKSTHATISVRRDFFSATKIGDRDDNGVSDAHALAPV